MRASPAFVVCVRCFGLWRAAVASLIAGTVAVQALWIAGRAADTPLPVSAALAALDALLLAAAAGAWRMARVELRWDTHRWTVDGEAARLAVALDLGAWMLLRLDHEAAGARRARTTWLPVQRRGLEAHWHALRCAVYCARPALGTDAGPNSAAGAESQE